MTAYESAGDDAEFKREQQKRARDAYRNYQVEQQKKELAKQFLESGAYERLMNIRVSNRELYDQLISYIVSLAQSGNIRGKVSETQFKSILARLTYRREPTIEFRHK